MQLLLRQRASLRWVALCLISFCFCWMVWPAQAHAATGTIADDAHVLNTSAIQQYTDPFSYTVDIFTTNVFQGSDDDFDTSIKGLTSNDTSTMGTSCDPTQQVGCELFSDQSMPIVTDPSSGTTISTDILTRKGDADQSVEIGINVRSRHLAIEAGSNVTISQDHYDTAIQTFADTMHQTGDNYTQATIAALNALQSASDRFWVGVWPFLLFPVVIALIIIAFILSRVARALGIQGSSSGSSWYGSNNWGGGGGGDWGGGGGSSDSGGGGGGASGNF